MDKNENSEGFDYRSSLKDLDYLVRRLSSTVSELEKELNAINGSLGEYKFPQLGILLTLTDLDRISSLFRDKSVTLVKFLRDKYGDIRAE